MVAICLIPLGGLLACVDSALSRVSAARVEELLREDRKGARSLRTLVTDRARYTNLLLLLRVTCELTATALVTIVARAQSGTRWPVTLLAVAVMVVVSYAVVGVGPRTIGRQHPYPVALAAAGAVRVLGRLFNPLASLLTLFGNAITPGRGFRDGPFASEVELRELVDMAEQRGVVEHGERQMIQSVFELGDTIAREVMVPRTEVVWIERNKTVPQALALALRSGFSRIPVTGENADDMIGVVYLKDLARRAQDAERARATTVEEVMRQVGYVPESKPVDELLREMQARAHPHGDRHRRVRRHRGAGHHRGHPRGDRRRDHRRVRRGARPGRTPRRATRARVSARLAVEDLGELFGVEMPDRDDVETVGGLLAEALGRVPIPGARGEASRPGAGRRERRRAPQPHRHRPGQPAPRAVGRAGRRGQPTGPDGGARTHG